MEAAHQTILIISKDSTVLEAYGIALNDAGFDVRTAKSGSAILDVVQDAPPQCFIVPRSFPGTGSLSLVEELKGDNIYGHVPILMALEEQELKAVDWAHTVADDYVVGQVPATDLIARVSLCIQRAQRDINANPLTGLPGNLTIFREAERRLKLGEPFAVAYLDLDKFKPFNDKYGFARGDEVLKMTARVLMSVLRNQQSRDMYVGHVGGDDFIFMTPSDLVEAVSQEVIQNFDLIVPNFYDEDDKEREGIESVDRQGNKEFFPMMGCSIAIVDTQLSGIKTSAEISQRSAEVKKFAKSVQGSNYVIDRRK